MNETIHVSRAELLSVITTACERAGLSPEAAAATAASLTEAECSGKRSHGLLRVEHVVSETLLEPPGPVEFETRGESFLGINGNRHLGYYPGMLGIEQGVIQAEHSGICFVGIRNCRHSGMLGYFVRQIADRGYWGMAMAHCVAKMAPHGGTQSILGTNPIALGVPRTGHPPFVMDFSPAAYTFGAMSIDRKNGRELPPGVGLDSHGHPSRDPAQVMDGGTILPSAGHKGAALALMVQLFCGPFTGAAALPEKGGDYGLTLMIFRPGLFHDPAQTFAGVEAIFGAIEGCAPQEGFSAVRLPGSESQRALEEAAEHGLDVDRKLWDRALELAARPPRAAAH